MTRALLIFVLVLVNAALANSDSTSISTFRERFSLRFLCNYNFVSIWNSELKDEYLISNRPVDLGLGFGYDSLFTLFGSSWDFSWDFKFALPFTTSNGKSSTQSFETELNFFPRNWWLEGKFRSYSGFTTDAEDDAEFVDLWILDMYLSALWMATAHAKFSPRSAYFLDRRQAESAGSMILGGRIQRNIAEDKDSVLAYYDNRRDLKTLWLDMGYTYSWIYDNGMFLNVWGVVGIAYGRERADDGYAVLPESDLRMAIGYLGEKWSWNTVLKAGYSAISYSEHWEQKFVSSFEILVVRRF